MSAGVGARGMGRMGAWRVHAYGGVEELRLEAARVPCVVSPRDMVVRVLAASLNPLDVAMARGYGAKALAALRAAEGREQEALPLVCGRDFVGEPVVCGASVSAALRRSRRLWGVVAPHRAGAHAHYVLVKDSWVSPAPSALSDAECGGGPYAALTACAALRAGGLGARGPGGARGARLLVVGLGGVGQAAVQVAAARGARVRVLAAGEQAALAASLGAADLVDRHEDGWWERVARGGPYTAVLDCAGLGGEWEGARGLPAARYVTLTSPLLRDTDAHGLAAGAARAAAAFVGQQWGAARGGAGARGGPCPPHVRWAFFSPCAADLEELRQLAESGRFRVVVEREFPWWEGAAAYGHVARGGARGKVLLDWTKEPDRGVGAL